MRSHVVLHVTRNRYWVETTIHAKGTQWDATAEDKDMYLAIDRVVRKFDRQTTNHKGEIVDHHQKEGGLKNHPNT